MVEDQCLSVEWSIADLTPGVVFGEILQMVRTECYVTSCVIVFGICAAEMTVQFIVIPMYTSLRCISQKKNGAMQLGSADARQS